MDVVVLLIVSYAAYVFLGESVFLFRLDQYSPKLSLAQRQKKYLAVWCSLSILGAGASVSFLHGSLFEPSSLTFAILLAALLAAPALMYYFFAWIITGV